MAVLLDFCRCPVCGQFHDFCLPNTWIVSEGESYAFICPTTGRAGELKGLSSLGEPVDDCPPGVVELWRVRLKPCASPVWAIRRAAADSVSAARVTHGLRNYQ